MLQRKGITQGASCTTPVTLIGMTAPSIAKPRETARPILQLVHFHVGTGRLAHALTALADHLIAAPRLRALIGQAQNVPRSSKRVAAAANAPAPRLNPAARSRPTLRRFCCDDPRAPTGASLSLMRSRVCPAHRSTRGMPALNRRPAPRASGALRVAPTSAPTVRVLVECTECSREEAVRSAASRAFKHSTRRQGRRRSLRLSGPRPCRRGRRRRGSA